MQEDRCKKKGKRKGKKKRGFVLAFLLLGGVAFGDTTETLVAVADSVDVIVKRSSGRHLALLAEFALVIDAASTVTVGTSTTLITNKIRSDSKTRVLVWTAIGKGDLRLAYLKCQPIDRAFIRIAARRLRLLAIAAAQAKTDEITSATLGLD